MDKIKRPFHLGLMNTLRLAVRALILHADRVLLVNAYPERNSNLWCAPGGGVEAGSSLPENLMREVMEETGLTVAVGAPVLVNEFNDPAIGLHQVEIFFRCIITAGQLDPDWLDPEHIVTDRRFFTRAEMMLIRFKPDTLPVATWDDRTSYDPMEQIVR